MKIFICGSHLHFLTPEGQQAAYNLIYDELLAEHRQPREDRPPWDEIEWLIVTGAGPSVSEFAHTILLEPGFTTREHIFCVQTDYENDGGRNARAIAYKYACEMADEVWVFWSGGTRDGAKWSIKNALDARKDIRVRFV